MDRRSFFRSMVGGIAAAAAVRTFPFRVFSFPSEIAIPEVLPVAGSQFLNISMISREALLALENSLQFTRLVNRDFDQDFGAATKIGTVLNIRTPMRYMNA